jgi:hypothetical protein
MVVTRGFPEWCTLKTIQIDSDLFALLAAQAARAGETIAQTLRRQMRIPAPAVLIEVDDDVYGHLVSRAKDLGELASSVIRRELHIAAEPADQDDGLPAVLPFHIRPGTGASAWNTPDETVVVSVGDTLRIVNDDVVPHRLHTSGVPFPHAAQDILPGQSQDHVARVPFNPGPGELLHDHAAGPSAPFHLRVLTRP